MSTKDIGDEAHGNIDDPFGTTQTEYPYGPWMISKLATNTDPDKYGTVLDMKWKEHMPYTEEEFNAGFARRPDTYVSPESILTYITANVPRTLYPDSYHW